MRKKKTKVSKKMSRVDLFTTLITCFSVASFVPGSVFLALSLKNEGDNKIVDYKFNSTQMSYTSEKESSIHFQIIFQTEIDCNDFEFESFNNTLWDVIQIVNLERNGKIITGDVVYKDNVDTHIWQEIEFKIIGKIKDKEYESTPLLLTDNSNLLSGGNKLANNKTDSIFFPYDANYFDNIYLVNLQDNKKISFSDLKTIYGLDFQFMENNRVRIQILKNQPSRKSLDFSVAMVKGKMTQKFNVSYYNSVENKYFDFSSEGIITGPSSLWNKAADISQFDCILFNSSVKKIAPYAFTNKIPSNIKKISFDGTEDCFIGKRSFSGGLMEELDFETDNNRLIIGAEAFYGCINLKKIDMIGCDNFDFEDEDGASFRGCYQLQEVLNFSHITRVPRYTFYDCLLLEKIDISQINFFGNYSFSKTGLRHLNLANCSLGVSAFYLCKNLSTVSIDSVSQISTAAFSSCSALLSVKINDVDEIDKYAFQTDYSIKTLSITSTSPISNLKINSYAFFGCFSLETLVIDNFLSIGNLSFEDCTRLKDVTISSPNPESAILENAFSGCTGLSSLHLNNIKTIQKGSFKGCVNLQTLYIKNITNLSVDAFKDCRNIYNVTIDNENINSWVVNTDNVRVLNLININISSPYHPTFNMTNVTQLTINDSNMIFDEETFADSAILDIRIINSTVTFRASTFKNYNIDTLQIIDSFCKIEDNAFSGSNITSVTGVGSASVSIGNRAFYNCKNLYDFNVFTASDIEEEAFSGCISLEKFYIHDSITGDLGSDIFLGCDSLYIDNIYFGEEQQYWETQNKAYIVIRTPTQYGGTSGIGILSTDLDGSSPWTIAENIFFGVFDCDEISVVFPNFLYIDFEYNFAGCFGITEILFFYHHLNAPPTVATAGMFDGCYKLNTVSTGHSFTPVANMFSGCDSLETINFRDNINNVQNMFNNCTSIKTIDAIGLTNWFNGMFGGDGETSVLEDVYYGKAYYSDFPDILKNSNAGTVLFPFAFIAGSPRLNFHISNSVIGSYYYVIQNNLDPTSQNIYVCPL